MTKPAPDSAGPAEGILPRTEHSTRASRAMVPPPFVWRALGQFSLIGGVTHVTPLHARVVLARESYLHARVVLAVNKMAARPMRRPSLIRRFGGTELDATPPVAAQGCGPQAAMRAAFAVNAVVASKQSSTAARKDVRTHEGKQPARGIEKSLNTKLQAGKFALGATCPSGEPARFQAKPASSRYQARPVFEPKRTKESRPPWWAAWSIVRRPPGVVSPLGAGRATLVHQLGAGPPCRQSGREAVDMTGHQHHPVAENPRARYGNDQATG